MRLVEVSKSLLVKNAKTRKKILSPQLIRIALPILFTFSTDWETRQPGNMKHYNEKGPSLFSLLLLHNGKPETYPSFPQNEKGMEVRYLCSLDCCFANSAEGQSGKCLLYLFLLEGCCWGLPGWIPGNEGHICLLKRWSALCTGHAIAQIIKFQSFFMVGYNICLSKESMLGLHLLQSDNPLARQTNMW